MSAPWRWRRWHWTSLGVSSTSPVSSMCTGEWRCCSASLFAVFIFLIRAFGIFGCFEDYRLVCNFCRLLGIWRVVTVWSTPGKPLRSETLAWHARCTIPIITVSTKEVSFSSLSCRFPHSLCSSERINLPSSFARLTLPADRKSFCRSKLRWGFFTKLHLVRFAKRNAYILWF